MTNPAGRTQNITQHVAFRALFKSMLINMAAPALCYHWAQSHFPGKGLWPLAISGLPPILWLAYSVLRLHAVDFLGLFAAENVAVRVCALLLAHSERGALIGRSTENVILAAVFLASLAFAKPIIFYMARQFATGNDPGRRESFDAAAGTSAALHIYRALTWVWVLGLLIKAYGAYWLATHVETQNFLMFSPLWDLMSDVVLVTASVLYGGRQLAPSSRDLRMNAV